MPQAVLAAAQRTLRCLRLLVRLTAALAAEDKAAALPLARQLLDAAPGHPMALVLAAQCQASGRGVRPGRLAGNRGCWM